MENIMQVLERKSEEEVAQEAIQIPIEVPPEVTIKFTNQRATLAQIFVSGIEFSLISGDNEQCHQSVLCPEFLIDAVDSTINSRPVTLYGFSYNSNKQPKIDMASIRLLIGNKLDDSFSDRIPGILDVLNQVETRLDLRFTVAQKVLNSEREYKSGQFVLVGSSRWLEAGPMLSLYTLLVRVGCLHKAGDHFRDTINKIIKEEVPEYQHYDKDILEKGLPTLELLLKIGYRPIFFINPKDNYPSKIDTPTLHHCASFEGLAEKKSVYVKKWWTREDLKNKPSLDERRANAENAAKEEVKAEVVSN